MFDQFSLNCLVVRLVDGVNETIERKHMWRTDLSKSSILLWLVISVPVHISAINVWNYNESEELSYAGVSILIFMNIVYTDFFHMLNHV